MAAEGAGAGTAPAAGATGIGGGRAAGLTCCGAESNAAAGVAWSATIAEACFWANASSNVAGGGGKGLDAVCARREGAEAMAGAIFFVRKSSAFAAAASNGWAIAAGAAASGASCGAGKAGCETGTATGGKGRCWTTRARLTTSTSEAASASGRPQRCGRRAGWTGRRNSSAASCKTRASNAEGAPSPSVEAWCRRERSLRRARNCSSS